MGTSIKFRMQPVRSQVEEHKPSDLKQYERPTTRERPPADEIERTVTTGREKPFNTREIIQEHLKERAQKASRRKWGGRGLVILGAVIILGSCPLYAFSLIGPQTGTDRAGNDRAGQRSAGLAPAAKRYE